ncbi:flagellar basal body rod protein [Methylobacterium nodulans ORS 2060]|uniref:Flagellar basal body rod protein n=1 Tax=Methylobacterium nodulans (strain LMG 21967 / CNCM I-2342 / ORS 2060) TaxID=460265 RepID=B8ID00_METNO|nr:flagellar basal body rod protein [Methylobacterium nodulans ORS 2060]
MSGVYLIDLALREAQHLSARQATVAGNIANADTPGYRARDVVPFRPIPVCVGPPSRLRFGRAVSPARRATGRPAGAGPPWEGDEREGMVALPHRCAGRDGTGHPRGIGRPAPDRVRPGA